VQFHIRTLLVVMVVVSMLCGVVFAASPLVAFPVLCVALWVSPSFWLCGILYARGAWRSFFIGGAAAGFVPHWIANYYSLRLTSSVLSGPMFVDLPEVFYYLDAVALSPNLMFAVVFLSPTVVAFVGGLVATWTYWTFYEPTFVGANPR
jgi:hypothetical protein